jgi:hypothetical protein
MDNARVYYPSAVSEEAASSVEVGVGADVRGIDIHLFKVARPSRFHVTGKVMGAQAGTLISLGYGDAGPPDYLFDLSLPAGQHTIFAHVYSGGPEAFAIETLTVAGNITGLVLTMRPPPEVSGQIRLAESGRQADLKGVIITLNNHPTYLIYNQYAKSDALGQFVFAQPVPPGRYAMKVNPGSLPNGCFVQQMTLGRQEVSEGDVEILTSTSLEIVLSNTAGTITGSAADDDGKLFPNSIVTLIPPDAKSRPVKQVADDDGNFKFTNLRPGKYKLFAWEEVDDGLWPDPEFRKAYEKRATEITVGPKETQSAQLRVIAAQEIK